MPAPNTPIGRGRPRMPAPANRNMPPLVAGVLGRCPRCGSGRLFHGFLSLEPKCSACELDYGFSDPGDGPAVFIILLVGFLVMAAALITEVKYHPPIWLHLTLWLPLVVILSLGLLRPMKGALIAIQFANKAREGRLAPDADAPAGTPLIKLQRTATDRGLDRDGA